MSPRICAYLAAVLALLASGAFYHMLGSDAASLQDALERVAQAPMVVGDWQGQDDATDADAFAQAGAKAYWSRLYVHRQSKASVLVILMCGRSGRMAVHRPEVCYGGAGFDLHDTPARQTFKMPGGERSADFWTAHFTKKTPGAVEHLRLHWAWNARAVWEAPAMPRWQFRGQPFLYKLYVSRDANRASGAARRDDPTAEFLGVFLPALDETLFPGAKPLAG